MAVPTRPSQPASNRLLTAFALILFGLLFGCGDGIPDFTPEELVEATAKVEEAYRQMDYEFGAELGERWAAWAPHALELKAWTVANFCGAKLGGMAEGMAEEMMATYPDSPWSSLALGMVRVAGQDKDQADDAMEASEKALTGLPDLTDAVILRGRTLFFFQDPDSAMAFVGTLSESQLAHPDVRVALAEAQLEAGLPTAFVADDVDQALEALLEEARLAYEGILQEHPSHIAANLGAQQFTQDDEAASEYIQRAVDQSFSPAAHIWLWQIIQSDSTLTEEQKTERISADVHAVLAEGGESPARRAAMAIGLGAEGMTDLQVELEEPVLREHEDSWAAEMILKGRIDALVEEIWGAPGVEEGWDADRKVRLAGMLDDFIDRDRHHDAGGLLEARWSAFLLEREGSDADPKALRDLAMGVVNQMEVEQGSEPGWYYGLMALTLAEHPATLADADTIVTLGLAELDMRAAMELDKKAKTEEVEPVAAEAQAAEPNEDADAETEEGDPEIRAERALFAAAQAQALIQEGRFDEAEEELTRARDLDPENYSAMDVLPFSYLGSGQLMEKKAERARAEGEESEAQEFLRLADGFYLEGVGVDYFAAPDMGMPWVNPNETALESLFQEMHGSLDGFAAYVEAAKDADWEERREEILTDRIQDPKPMTTFVLETLDGEEVSSESLLGRVAVINFWGTW